MVYPLEWAEEGPRHWRMFLRCPDCEATREGVFSQKAVDMLADELDRGESVLLCTLKRVTHENMTEAIVGDVAHSPNESKVASSVSRSSWANTEMDRWISLGSAE
jgi:hypothetical protein